MERWNRFGSALFAPALLACSAGGGSSGRNGDAGCPTGEPLAGDDAGPAFSVFDVLLAPSVDAGMQCSFTSSPAQPSIASGLLDIALSSEYNATYLLANPLAAQFGPNDPFDPSAIGVGGATVRITSADNVPLASFTRLVNTAIDPFQACAPGYSPLTTTVVDPATLSTDPDTQALAAAPLGGPARVRLLTYVRFYGGTVSGQSLESNEFEFPVDVCNGCLIRFTNAPGSPAPNCIGGFPDGGPSPCFLGQDVPIDCDQCAELPACQGSQ